MVERLKVSAWKELPSSTNASRMSLACFNLVCTVLVEEGLKDRK